MCPFSRFIPLLALLLIGVSCSTTPTGRKQLNLVNDGQISELGAQSFEQLKKEKPISKDQKLIAPVQCITKRLLTVMGEDPAAWEVLVFVDDSPNAFALPGRKLGVHTGMMKLVKNQDQLAAVLGHEIGHVLAHHGAERMSQGMLTQVGLQAADLVLGQDSQKNQLIMGALGLGAQFGILLPYGRKQESEADTLGVRYMAKAGFDPAQSVELWRLMAQASGGQSSPEFMSTHPSNETRIKDLSSLVPQHLPVYQAVADKPHCGI